MMGEVARKKIDQGENPFHFEDSQNYTEKKPLVIMATPGMLQNGLSRDLFEEWCEDEKNGIIFTGYSVEGTLAKQVMNKPSEIKIGDKNKTLKLNMTVEVISFSAHCDFKQTSHFIKEIKPPNIVLVHGDQNEMAKLKKELDIIYKEEINVLAPRNCQPVKFSFVTDKSSKMLGKAKDTFDNFLNTDGGFKIDRDTFESIAKNLSQEENKIDNKMLQIDHEARNPEEIKSQQIEEDAIMKEFNDNMVTIEGLFVENKLENMIIDETEINEFTSLSKNFVSQQQVIPYKYDPEFLIEASRDLFDSVELLSGNLEDLKNDIILKIEGIDVVYRRKAECLELSWNSSPKCDLITDAIGLLAIQLSNNPPANMVKSMVNHRKEKKHSVEQFKVFQKILREHCEEIKINENNIIEIYD